MTRRPLILIVDDEKRVREALELMLEPLGANTAHAGSAEIAFEVLKRRPVDLILLDLYLPQMKGLEALEILARDYPQTPCVMISGQGTIADAVRAVQLGAYDYLEKPVQPDRLSVLVEKALAHRRLLGELEARRDEARRKWQLVGSSPQMQRLRDEISRAAPSNGWVLIEGENGTGKELVARLIHEASGRRERPFVRLNSAALPTELVESELFGHEAGAFTGATRRRMGKLEQAHGGTLFLDEVADMDLAAQAKLLRALSTGEVERVGGSDVLEVDVRLICATNRDLRAAVAADRFREDLYFRICVVPIRVPPLRERGGDILELADHFLSRHADDNGRPAPRLDDAARRLLESHSWPGNVRELRNLMERLAIMHPADRVTAADLRLYLEASLPRAAPAAAEEPGTAPDPGPAPHPEPEETSPDASLRER
ncbi:MAG: response regulator, partial [Candidatus Eisenbacteria bacterium]|nr:response regulator [Candidatus Eisenbacteria bacterium]